MLGARVSAVTALALLVPPPRGETGNKQASAQMDVNIYKDLFFQQHLLLPILPGPVLAKSLCSGKSSQLQGGARQAPELHNKGLAEVYYQIREGFLEKVALGSN